MALNPTVQFRILDDLTKTVTDKGYTLDIYKFKFEVVKESIPYYISDYNFIWEFGDGEFSTEISPTHWYKAPGTYEVTLQLFGIDENNKYVSFKNSISKFVNIYNFTPNYEYNSYNDFIEYINVDGLSNEKQYYWNVNPVINFTISAFNSWQSYEVNKGINKINLNVTKSNYPLLKSDMYNSNLYLHLAASDKFLNNDNQPINSIVISGNPIYVTRNQKDGSIKYIDNVPGATFIGTSAIGNFKYSGMPFNDYQKNNEETIIEISMDETPFRINYDIKNNIINSGDYPIMLSKPYGFSFYNKINYNTIEDKISGFITSSGVDSNLFNIFEYKYKGLPINFIFRLAIMVDGINYPISFIDNFEVSNQTSDGWNIYLNKIQIGVLQLKYYDEENNEHIINTNKYTLETEIVKQPEPFDSSKGGYIKGVITYNYDNNPDIENCFIEVTLKNNPITLQELKISKIIRSSNFNILNRSSIDIRKINEDFSLANEFHKNNLQPTLKSLPFLDNFVNTLFGNIDDPNSFTVRLYERISNYISNINDIDTCTVDALYDQYHLVNLYITNLNYIYPPNLRRIIDLFSVNLCKLKGSYNYYGLDFDKKGYVNNLYGKNLGNLLDINTYNITSGVPIVAKEKFSNKYSLINTDLVVNQIEKTPLSVIEQIYPDITYLNEISAYTYPLKYYKLDNNNTNIKQISDIGWGWNLILPSSFNLSDYYDFYEYKPTQLSSLENLDNLIDCHNQYNNVQMSSINSLDDWNVVKTKYLTQSLYDNLILSKPVSA